MVRVFDQRLIEGGSMMLHLMNHNKQHITSTYARLNKKSNKGFEAQFAAVKQRE